MPLLAWRSIKSMKIYGIVLAVMVLAVALWVVSPRLLAAAPNASLETESGTIGTNATKVADTTASAGQAVKFSSGAFQANCIDVPSVCGYPDATNTGVPAGTALTSSGSITVTVDGTVISGKDITGQVIIKANNVTIKNSRITSSDYYPIDYSYGKTGLLLQDMEIAGTNSNVTAGVSFDSYTARRVYIHGTADGFKANGSVLIEDSYVTALAVGTDTHNDGVQTTGGDGVTVRHSTFKLGDQSGISSVMQFGTESGTQNTHWLVENNLIDGGGWSINSSGLDGTNQFLNNRFTRRSGYGPGRTDGAAIWSGNYYDDDGSAIP